MSIKKTLAGIASYALVGAVAIGGTLAFQFDEEAAMNTLAIGDGVDIVINEQQRTADGDALEEFDQGKVLYPIVGEAQGTKDKWGMPTVDAAKNYVDKIVTIENTGQADAYVRVFVAIPTELLGESIEDDGDDVLHWNWGNRVDTAGTYPIDNEVATKAWSDAWSDLWAYNNDADADFTAIIEGQEYTVSTFYTRTALEPGAATRAVMAGLYLDTNVDYDNGVYTRAGKVINYDFSKGVSVPIFADAVEAVDDVGYKAAFEGRDAAEVFKNWADEVKAPVLVESANELTAAIGNGQSVVLTEDIELSAYLNITAGKEITIDLNGHNIVRNGGTAIYVNNKDAVVNIEGDGKVEGLDGIYVNAGTVNIYGGTYNSTGNVTIYTVTSDATVNIFGGTFSSLNGTYVLNLRDNSNSKITVFGGTFVNFNPDNNASENPQQSFVANGYKSVDNGDGTYTVEAE